MLLCVSNLYRAVGIWKISQGIHKGLSVTFPLGIGLGSRVIGRRKWDRDVCIVSL